MLHLINVLCFSPAGQMSLAQAQAEALKSIAASQQQVQQIPGPGPPPVSEYMHFLEKNVISN